MRCSLHQQLPGHVHNPFPLFLIFANATHPLGWTPVRASMTETYQLKTRLASPKSWTSTRRHHHMSRQAILLMPTRFAEFPTSLPLYHDLIILHQNIMQLAPLSEYSHGFDSGASLEGVKRSGDHNRNVSLPPILLSFPFLLFRIGLVSRWRPT